MKSSLHAGRISPDMHFIKSSQLLVYNLLSWREVWETILRGQTGGVHWERTSVLFSGESWFIPTGDSIFEMSMQNSLPPYLKFHSCETEGLWRAERQEEFFFLPSWSYLTVSSQVVLINTEHQKVNLTFLYPPHCLSIFAIQNVSAFMISMLRSAFK